ncbi:MAG: FecR domain-containing protein, partial [Reyranella sp.]|nr:FecR domain-containing protein [Reyranella sp.]
MAKSAVRSLSVLCALLLGVAAFTLVGAASAIAKVGVTSATDGDPLGKPPTEAERVLRVGIDVQANELITTRADDRAHLMFLDGTALTIGPDASIVIDKFVYDPNTKTGDLAITATKGVFRLVGGRISKTNPITITTPSSTIGIRGGVGILNVNSRETISFFIFGFSMTIGANGRIETVTRPGSEVTTLFGSGPGRPRMITAGVMNGILGQLQGSGKGGSPGGGSGNADQSAQNSGFSNSNSGKGTNVSGTRSFDNFGSGPGPNNRNPNDTVVTALTQANETAPSLQPTTPKTENIIPIVNTMT